MTELETMERAKMYMEKLANGINPLDGSIVPDDDLINHVRLSRCFFYVADILRQVIEKGGLAKKKTKTIPFYIPIEKRNTCELSESPIPISELTRRINALVVDNDMKTLKYLAIRNWLFSLGMLEDALDADGKTVKHPTQRGESMGILLESRNGHRGPYSVVVYTLTAQKFILDNLDAIIPFNEKPDKV